MLVALTLWFMVVVQRAKSAPQLTTIGWAVLALFFTYMTSNSLVHFLVCRLLNRVQRLQHLFDELLNV